MSDGVAVSQTKKSITFPGVSTKIDPEIAVIMVDTPGDLIDYT